MRGLDFSEVTGELLDEGFKALHAELEPYEWESVDEDDQFIDGYQIITIN